MYVCTCVRVHVCMYVCMHACMHVIYVCTYVHMCVYMTRTPYSDGSKLRPLTALQTWGVFWGVYRTILDSEEEEDDD